MSEATPIQPTEHEPATVELEDGSLAPRYGITPYGGLPAACDNESDHEER